MGSVSDTFHNLDIPMKNIRTVIALTMLASVSACASGGNASIRNTTITEVDQNIHDGVTTSAQVRQIYGEPSETTYENGHEVWTYSFSSDRSDGLSIAQNVVGLGVLGTKSNSRTKALSITFRNGVVLKHSFSTANSSIGSGLRQ